MRQRDVPNCAFLLEALPERFGRATGSGSSSSSSLEDSSISSGSGSSSLSGKTLRPGITGTMVRVVMIVEIFKVSVSSAHSKASYSSALKHVANKKGDENASINFFFEQHE